MRDDSRDGIAAAVVFAKYLAQKSPDGRNWVEHSVAICNAMFIENVLNAGFRQDIRERKPVIAQSGRVPHPGLTLNRLQIESDSNRLVGVQCRRCPVLGGNAWV